MIIIIVILITYLIRNFYHYYYDNNHHCIPGYDRPNLFFEVREKSKKGIDTMPAMLKYVRTHPPNTTGIVYCFSKKDCEKAAAFLTFNNVSYDTLFSYLQ